jgi:hypothetical protein
MNEATGVSSEKLIKAIDAAALLPACDFAGLFVVCLAS